MQGGEAVSACAVCRGWTAMCFLAAFDAHAVAG